MDKKKQKIQIWLFCLLCVSAILLGACEYSPSSIVSNWGEKIDVKIYAPVDGSEWIVDQPIEIHSLVSAPNVVRSIVLLINGQEDREDLFAHPTFTRGSITQTWTPTREGVYTIQAILRDAKDEAESNIVTILVVEPTRGPLTIVEGDTETPTITSTMTLTPSPTITKTPDQGKPEAEAGQNLNCRRGPSTEYDTVWYFLQGQTAPITGRTNDSNWLLIERGDGNGECWVSRSYVYMTGEPLLIPIITPPSLLPTHTSTVTESPYTNCGDYPDMVTCNQDPMGFGGCSWDTGLNVCQP